MRILVLLLAMGWSAACRAQDGEELAHINGFVSNAEAEYGAVYRPIRVLLDVHLNPKGMFWEPHRAMSRAEFGVAVWQCIQLSAAFFEDGHEGALVSIRDRPEVRQGWSKNFWRLEYLWPRLIDVIVQFGVSGSMISERLALARAGFAREGLALENPLDQRFTDVPSGHWADGAIHDLRRAGVLMGFPDGKFFEPG